MSTEEELLVQKFMEDPDFEHGDEPKEEVARTMAKQYIRQMRNTRTALSMAKEFLEKAQKKDNPFAIATAQAKKQGHKNFKEGSPGDDKRDKIAEAIKKADEMPVSRPTPQGGISSGGTGGSALQARSPITLSINEMDFDQLEQTRKECEELEKGWQKKGWNNVALAYRQKMFDIDNEINRRAQEELQRLTQGDGNA